MATRLIHSVGCRLLRDSIAAVFLLRLVKMKYETEEEKGKEQERRGLRMGCDGTREERRVKGPRKKIDSKNKTSVCSRQQQQQERKKKKKEKKGAEKDECVAANHGWHSAATPSSIYVYTHTLTSK